MQTMVPASRSSSGSSRARPAAGPSTIAAAIARLSATTGLPVIRSSSPYRAEDLDPVGLLGRRCLVMDRGDRRLHLVLADNPAAPRAGDQRVAFADQIPVPEGPVLLGERDQRAVRGGAGRPARLGQQHQREQTADLWIVGKSQAGDPRKPDRLGR